MGVCSPPFAFKMGRLVVPSSSGVRGDLGSSPLMEPGSAILSSLSGCRCSCVRYFRPFVPIVFFFFLFLFFFFGGVG